MSTVQFDNDVVDAKAGDHADHAGMILIPGGTFQMGSDKHYPEEAPVHRVKVDSFFIDRTPVRLDIVFEPQEYAFVLPSGSELRKPLSVAILDVIQSDEWTEMKIRYLGPAAANSP